MSLPEDEAKRALAGQAQTYPIGQGPKGPGLNIETISDSTSPSSGQPNGGRTPVSPTQGPQGGGVDPLLNDRGSPEDMLSNMPPGQAEQQLMDSAQRVANMETPLPPDGADETLYQLQVKAQRKKPSDLLAAQGAPPKQALEELRDKRLKEYQEAYEREEISHDEHEHLKWSWKNIFEIVPEDELGLVLMDFGFRAMMAGETMGDMGALGAAGAGALGGIQERRRERQAQNVGALEYANERMDAENRQRADTINTEQGIFQFNPDTGKYDIQLKDAEGNPLTPSALAGRPSVAAYEIREWMKAGMTENEARIAALSGVSPQQARQNAEAQWERRATSAQSNRRATIRIPAYGDQPERSVRMSEATEADREAWIKERIRSYGYESGGALPQNTGSNAPSEPTGGGEEAQTEFPIYDTKPSNWTDEQWDQYNAARKEYEALQQ